MGPFHRFLVLSLLFVATCSALAQQPDTAHETSDAVSTDTTRARDGAAAVPHYVRFNGVMKDVAGNPRTGLVGLTFALYDQNDGGAAIWQETQNVTLDDAGRYNVLLGATKSRGLPMEPFASGEARFIGVRVVEENGVEQPRVRLVSVPYALSAGDAQSLGGRPVTDFALTKAAAAASGDSSQAGLLLEPMTTSGTEGFIGKFTSATDIGDSIMFDTGANIGIGTSNPSDPLHVNGAIRFGAGTFVAGQAKLFTSAQHGTLLTANTGSSNDIALVSASGNLLLTNPTGTNNLVMLSGGSLGVNTSNVTERLTVNGGIRFGPSSFSAGAPTLYVDAAHGSVLTGSQGSSNDLALVSRVGNLLLTNPTNTNNLVFFSGGNFGLNTFTPTTLLDVNGVVRAAGGIKFSDNTVQPTAVPGGCTLNQIPKWSGTAWACAADATGTGTITGITTSVNSGITGGGLTGTLALSLLTSCTTGQVLQWSGTAWVCTTPVGGGGLTLPFTGTTSSASAAFKVTQSNSVVLQSDPTFASAQTSIPAAVVGIASTTSNTAVGIAAFNNTLNAPALVGWNGATGTTATGEAQGVVGISDAINGVGVAGNSNALTGTGDGVQGYSNSPNGAAIHGISDVNNYAGKFDGGKVLITGPLQLQSAIVNPGGGSVAITGGLNVTSGGAIINGNVSVVGNLSKSSGTFKIDHPLDPAGKYLYHSFVESPDMMNIYNGIIILDSKGQAWVTLPNYFEALNMDFRYQLTSLGQPAPNLFVAREIYGNRFKISGGKPRGRVSWQVTGVRHDAYADAHRIQVEEDKPANEHGTYLHPELFKDVEKKLAKK